MTAPRTCRVCGADLKGDVMWCLRCYAQVRQLTPRKPQLPTVQFVRPRDERSMSRWKAGVTTFGPVGRITITLLVLLFAPWSTNLVMVVVAWPCYLLLAALVLRSTWRKDSLQAATHARIAGAGRPAEPPPAPVRTRTPRSTIVVWLLLASLGIGIGGVWASSGQAGRGVIVICASLAALVLAVRWLTRP